MQRKIFIGGMNCVECVRDALKNIGAKDIEVSFIIEVVDDVTDELIKLSIENIGYEVLAIE